MSYADILFGRLAGNNKALNRQVTVESSGVVNLDVKRGNHYCIQGTVTELNVTSVEHSLNVESEITFTADPQQCAVSLPAEIGTIPEEPFFEAGSSYIINFRGGIAVIAAYTPGASE